VSAGLVKRWRRVALAWSQAITGALIALEPPSPARALGLEREKGYAEALRDCANGLERSLARKAKRDERRGR
jgi:hypothetical protein